MSEREEKDTKKTVSKKQQRHLNINTFKLTFGHTSSGAGFTFNPALSIIKALFEFGNASSVLPVQMTGSFKQKPKKPRVTPFQHTLNEMQGCLIEKILPVFYFKYFLMKIW